MHPVSNGAYATSLAPPLSDHQTYSQKLGLDLDTCMYHAACKTYCFCMFWHVLCSHNVCVLKISHPKPWPLQTPCLGGPGVSVAPCLASLVVFDAVHQLSFVQGVAWYGTRAAQRQVAQRFSR